MASPTAQKTSLQPSPSSSPGPPTPGPSKGRKPRASLAAIELSSGSDDDDERAARLAQFDKARAAERFKALDAVKTAIPDVDPRVILEMFRNRDYHQDPDLIASAILESNYRLREGGWKWGYDPAVGPSGSDNAGGSGEHDLQKKKKEKKVRRAENDSGTDSDSDSGGNDNRRASGHKAGKIARKSPKQKRARQQSSDEEEDGYDEVDQLASDNDAAGSGQGDDDDDGDTATYDEVMEQEGYWLNPEERDPPEESYRKAALNKYAENHIRNRFESDECDGKYAPAWFDLRRLQLQGDLLQLKGPPRDMDAPIIMQDGTKRVRKAIEQSKTLEKEARWLGLYLKYGGKGLHQKQKKKKEAAAKRDQSKKRQKESLEARRARLSGGEAVQKKKQKKQVMVRADSDEEMRSSDDDLTPIASTSTSNKARVKAKPESTPAKKRRVRFTSDDDEGECWDDLFGHGANSDGWGPAYQDKPSTSPLKGQKKKQTPPAVGSWASSNSGAFNVKEEEREWFIGQGRRLGD